MARMYHLKDISEDETHHYTSIFSSDSIEEEIYAMAYAYVKMCGGNEEKPQAEIIEEKNLEMKKRNN